MALKRGVEEIQEPKSPSKKVKFQDTHRSTNGLQPSTKAPLFVQDEVRYAITRHLTGDDAGYDRIKSAFEPKESTIEEISRDTTIVHYIQALLDNVALLQSSCSGLVNAVLYTDWAVKGDEYVGLYMRFLANLLSVKGTYLVDVLRVLTDHLTWGEWQTDPPPIPL